MNNKIKVSIGLLIGLLLTNEAYSKKGTQHSEFEKPSQITAHSTDIVAINFKVNDSVDLEIDEKARSFKTIKSNGKSKNHNQLISTLNKIYSDESLAPKRVHSQLPKSDLVELRRKALSNGYKMSQKQALPKLENWMSIPVTNGMTQKDIERIANKLNKLDFVDVVEFETPVVSARIFEECPDLTGCEPDWPPGGGGGGAVTPDLQDEQDYLEPAPHGVDALYGWTQTGGTGVGVKIIDLENGLDHLHEDLPSLFYRSNDANNSDHGTAVVSVMGAKRDSRGITGIAYRSQFGFRGWGSSTAGSISAAASRLNAGDIMILEGQINRNIQSDDTCTSDDQSECVPMEWLQANYDAIRTASAAGIIVVEAAGNGGEDLDLAIYNNRFNRNVRDSGAIMVGAGSSNQNAFRLWFSNHGSRIDVNAWGENVASAGNYGSSLFDGGFHRQYGDGFGGTSSASPIVAGAIASIQGHYKATKGDVLNPNAMRNLLVETGSQQGVAFDIGPRPDIRAAMLRIRDMLVAPRANSYWDACYGMNTITWNAVSGATYYKVTSNAFGTRTTSSTSQFVNVTRSATATVQSCNGNGCSAESNTVHLIYRSACY